MDKTVEQKMKAVVDKFKTCLANVELNGVSVRRNLRQRAPKQSTYQTRRYDSFVYGIDGTPFSVTNWKHLEAPSTIPRSRIRLELLLPR